MKTIDLTGQKFNCWLVLRYSHSNKKDRFYECECDCGTIRTISGQSLKRGLSKSCGCLAKDLKVHEKHGERNSPEYGVWQAIKYRCLNPNCEAYKWYGGRGITICERWENSFENFLADVGRRPSSLHSIDRYPDKNGNYEPGNVRWATDKEQSNNQTSNRIINVNGEDLTCAQAADKYGFGRVTFHDRIMKGMSPNDAVSRPLNLSKSHKRK